MKRRLPKSLSDLDGTDPLIHDGTVRGVFRELSNALVKRGHNPELHHMNKIYRQIKTASPLIMRSAGARSLFEARVFKRLVVLATEYAESHDTQGLTALFFGLTIPFTSFRSSY